MKSLFWTACFAILLLLAVVDLSMLRRFAVGRGTGDVATPAARGIFSPFTLACQAAFAVFAALHVAPLAFEDFDAATGVMVGELVFLALMLLGALEGRRAAKA